MIQDFSVSPIELYRSSVEEPYAGKPHVWICKGPGSGRTPV